MRIALITLLAIYGSCFAAETDSAWQQVQLNEPFMRSLTKDQCVRKTITTLKSVCKDDSCIKTMGGVVGDCVTWAKGDITRFCETYDVSYNSIFCSAETFDPKRCEFIHIGKRVLCKQ